MNSTLKTALVGVGATALVDCFSFLLSLATHKSHGILYIGRWISYLFNGRWLHDTIMETPDMPGELLVGWLAHYSAGILFAFLLTAVFTKKSINKPSISSALIIGISTLFFPVFVLQPAMGFGIAFSKLPQWPFLLTKLFLIHAVYGVGLYWTILGLKYVQSRLNIITPEKSSDEEFTCSNKTKVH